MIGLMIEIGDLPVPRSAIRRILINLLWPLGLALLIAACSGAGPGTSPPGTRTATNIAVAPEFQRFYDQYGGARVFGFPISNPYPDTESGRLMQYFQHLRLEYNQTTGAVSVSQLGLLYAPPQVEPAPAVQGAFLTFYEAYGSELVFGSPITPQLEEGGRLVQYFQNAVLMWEPNNPPEFRVEVASLAEDHFLQSGRPGDVDGPFGPASSASVLEADVRATVKEPILYAGEEQVLYVTVITPDAMQLVPDATISATISYNNISTVVIFPNVTDALGQAQHVLELPGVNPGDMVTVKVEAIGVNDEVLGSTMLSFRTWW
jgi:hypothetical protein